MSDMTIDSGGERWVRLAWYEQQGQQLDEAQAEIAALREAVRVLGESHLSAWLYIDELRKCMEQKSYDRLAATRMEVARAAVDANPLARAAVTPKEDQ